MINFGGVDSGAERNEYKSVKGGVQNLTITEVKPLTSAGGSPGLTVTFESKEADASFNHRFWLSEKALSRVQYLMEKFTGNKIEDSFENEHEAAEKLGAKLVGTTKLVIVDVEKRSNNKNGKNYVNDYPTLRFAGFVDPVGPDAEVRVTDNSVASVPNEEVPSDLPF